RARRSPRRRAPATTGAAKEAGASHLTRSGAGEAGTCATGRLRRDYAGARDRRAHDVDDTLLCLGRDSRPERQREVLLPCLLGRGQRARLVAEVAQGGLQVKRRRVIRGRRDARLGERRADRLALARTADEEVVDVAGLVLRQFDELAEPELR